MAVLAHAGEDSMALMTLTTNCSLAGSVPVPGWPLC
jgi:hypothetical protein